MMQESLVELFSWWNPSWFRPRHHHSRCRSRSQCESGHGAVCNGSNPFMIWLVVTEILSHLSVNDLTKCRLVCKLWNEEAIKLLKQKIKNRKIPTGTIKNFVNVFGHPENLPLQSVSLQTREITRDYQTFFRFFSSSTSCLTSLKITLPCGEIPQFVKCLNQLTSLSRLVLIRMPEPMTQWSFFPIGSISAADLPNGKLPKLSSIVLRTAMTSQRGCSFPTYCDKAIVTILNAAGSLNCLEIIRWGSPLSQILREANLTGLKSLKVASTVGVSDSDIMILTRKGLSLQYVDLRVGDNVRKTTVDQFIKSLSHSLACVNVKSRKQLI